jgi:hypothetical protein
MSLRRLTPDRAARLVGVAGVAAVLTLAACGRRQAAAPAPAPRPASTAATKASRDSAYATDYRRTLVDYYKRVEWTYTDGRCAVTDPRGGLTRRFQCGRVRVGTQPGANVTDLVRVVKGRTVDLHPGDAPWRRIVVPVESERAAILRLLADGRVRWAGLDLQAQAPRSTRPPRRARPRP